MKISIVKYCQTLSQADFRLDADYYRPEFLAEDKQLGRYKRIPLGDLAFVTDGQHGYHEVDDQSPIFHLTAKNAKGWFANIQGADRIAKWVDDKNKRSSLKENDLILSTRGTLGYCAIVKADVLPANIDQDVARIAIEGTVLLPEFVLAFINCQYGQDWVRRNATGMVQQGISLQKVRVLPIPAFSDNLQSLIREVVNTAHQCLSKTQEAYEDAILIALTELGLSDWSEKHASTFVRYFSDTKHAKRIDAEYFQPKYDEVVNVIKGYAGGWDNLDNLAALNEKSFKPEDEQQYKYIELANVADNGEVAGCMLAEGRNLPSRARRKVAVGDVIVSSIEGSLSSVALISREYDQALCSTGFYVVNSEELNSETLLVLLKSVVGQMQMKKGCNGTILTAINKGEFSKIVLPKITKEKQAQIQQRITESLELRKQSKQLLEDAKRSVEIAVEESENKAEKWLQKKFEEVTATTAKHKTTSSATPSIP